jgi:hypothetical protein
MSSNKKKSSSGSKKSIYDGKIFYTKTSIVNPIKTTVNVLSGILNETVFYVSAPNPNKPDDFAGLEIVTSDGIKNVFIRVDMDADKFDDYYCKPKKYEFCICVQTLNEALKIIEKDDVMTMYIEENDTQNLTIEINNDTNGTHTILQISLFDPEDVYKEKESTDFDAEIVIDGGKFHKLIKEFSGVSEHIDLKCTQKNLIFTGLGKLLKRSTTHKINNGTLTIKKEDSKQKIIQGIYDIKNICLFQKCATLCNDISVFMKNNFALTLCYNIPKYGKITVAFTPIDDEIIKSNEYAFSDDEGDVEMISNDDALIDDLDSDFESEIMDKKSKKVNKISKKEKKSSKKDKNSKSSKKEDKKSKKKTKEESDSDSDFNYSVNMQEYDSDSD